MSIEGLEEPESEGEEPLVEIVEGAFGQKDEEAIETLINDSPLWSSYDDMDSAMRLKMNKIIREAYEEPDEFDMDKMTNKMREEVDVETYRLERIARTETTVVSAAGRESGFQKRDPEHRNS